MKKLLVMFVLFFTCASSVFAEGTTTFLKMTPTEKNSAVSKNLNYLISRNAFNNKDKDVLKDSFEKYKRDEDSKENIKAAKQGIVYKSDYILGIKYNVMYTQIMDYYSIKYPKQSDRKYLYDGFGNLIAVEIIKGTEFSYPYYTGKYSNTGVLNSVSYFASSTDEYLYDVSQTLTGVKVDGVLYSKKGIRLDSRLTNPVYKRVMPIKRQN